MATDIPTARQRALKAWGKEQITPCRSICLAFINLGVTQRREQAKLIGEKPTAWSRYLNDHRSPQTSKVQSWLDAAAKEGYTIKLEWAALSGASAVGTEADAGAAA